MTDYARLVDNRVAEIIAAPSGPNGPVPIDQAFHPDFAATLIEVTEETSAPSLGDVWNGTLFAAYVAPAPTRDELVNYAAQARFTRETGGVVVGGAQVATDRESQAMLAGAVAYVQANPSAELRWKAESGFVTLNAAAVEAVGLAVGAHVQACFAGEADVLAAIEDETVTSFAQIDAAFAAIS